MKRSLNNHISEILSNDMSSNNPTKELFLLRGLPGSGKSTIAKLLVNKDYCHKEADMYFVDRDGNYNFTPSQIKDAHKWCQDEVDFLMRLEHSPVVVSNTFTQEWEMQPYYDLAQKYGYRVYSLIVENRHGGVNEHGVPVEKLGQMINRFEIKL
jgi:ABC-type molybdenum transport system ATPase subunit/photorepair protein PhrA